MRLVAVTFTKEDRGMLKQKSSEYRGYRTAGVRLKEEMLPQLKDLYGSHTREMLPAVHAFDKAHIVMLVEERPARRESGRRVSERPAPARRRRRPRRSARRSAAGCIPASTTSSACSARTSRGSSTSRAARATSPRSAINRLECDRLLAIMRAVNALRRVLIDLAREHTDTIMPGYSFGQHAQPMTLGHLWLSWAATLARDFERLHGAYKRVNVSPAGAAIMVGSNFRVNRERTAELLGFDAVHENSADAILELNADDSLEVPAVVAVLYHSLAKWADDLVQWSTSEYNFVDIPDRYCNTSSIMMQKKNVIGPGEMKGAASEALGCFVVSYHALKGPTGLPVTERYYALEMLWKVADSAVRDLGWFCDLLPVLKINKAHMREQSWRALGHGDRSRRRAGERAEAAVAHARTRSSASSCGCAKSAGSGPPT